jgi:hypothetical protein
MSINLGASHLLSLLGRVGGSIPRKQAPSSVRTAKLESVLCESDSGCGITSEKFRAKTRAQFRKDNRRQIPEPMHEGVLGQEARGICKGPLLAAPWANISNRIIGLYAITGRVRPA